MKNAPSNGGNGAGAGAGAAVTGRERVIDPVVTTLATALRDAYAIHQQFIVDGAPFEVNLRYVRPLTCDHTISRFVSYISHVDTAVCAMYVCCI